MALLPPAGKLTRGAHVRPPLPPGINSSKPQLSIADHDCLKTPTMSDMLKTPTILGSPTKIPNGDDVCTPRLSISAFQPSHGQAFFGDHEPFITGRRDWGVKKGVKIISDLCYYYEKRVFLSF